MYTSSLLHTLYRESVCMSGPFTIYSPSYMCFWEIFKCFEITENEIWVVKSMFQLLFFWNIGRAQSFQN